MQAERNDHADICAWVRKYCLLSLRVMTLVRYEDAFIKMMRSRKVMESIVMLHHLLAVTLTEV